jgi:hypothetical protein
VSKEIRTVIADDLRPVFVERVQIHPAPYYYVYSAWESTDWTEHDHHTIQSTTGFGLTEDETRSKWLGKIGTRRSKCDLPPMTQERIDFVRAAYDKQYQESYALIIRAFPEATYGRQDSGEIIEQ